MPALAAGTPDDTVQALVPPVHEAASALIPAPVPGTAPAPEEAARSTAKPAPKAQATPAVPSGLPAPSKPDAPASPSVAEMPAKAPPASQKTLVKTRVLTIGKDGLRAPTIDKDEVRPLPPIPRGARYVQVGVFRDAANAERCVAALEKLKLPLSRGKGQIKGQAVDIILAGPFDDPWKLAEAMRAVRASGYPDAYPR